MKSFRCFPVFVALLFGTVALRAADAPKYGPVTDNKILAQKLVNKLMADKPGLLAAGMHCVRLGSDRQTIIASTMDVIGKPSDPEDILHGGTVIVPSQKAPKLGIMLPLHDRAGKEIGSLALQFKYLVGEDQVKYFAEATAIRDRLAAQIPTLTDLFTPVP